jgi:hypothetical protein
MVTAIEENMGIPNVVINPPAAIIQKLTRIPSTLVLLKTLGFGVAPKMNNPVKIRRIMRNIVFVIFFHVLTKVATKLPTIKPKEKETLANIYSGIDPP